MSWLDRERAEQQLDAELRFDFDQRVAEHLRAGMSEDEARRAARLEFGGIEQIKEECRDARGLEFPLSLLRDVRYAFRNMQRSPGFTAVAVMTLAVGIGVNAAVFTVTNATLFKGFRFVDRNDRILYIDTRRDGNGCCVSYPDFEDWRAQAKSFEGMGGFEDYPIILSDKSHPAEQYIGSLISANSFSLLGKRPILGRDFMPSDEAPGAAPVAILTYGLWGRRYGEDPAIIGQTVRVNGFPGTVIGVMPQDFSFPQNEDLWMPLAATPDLQRRGVRLMWFAFGRMAEGVTARSAAAEMETIGKRLEIAYPLTNQGRRPTVHNFAEFFEGRDAAAIYESIWGAVGFVVLIACANLANLLLVRSIGKSREISVRMALGARRRRIIRQLLVESLMLSTLGGVFGWWIARWGVRAYELVRLPPGVVWQAPELDFGMDYRVLAYLVAISIGTGILFGLAPALRLSKLDVNGTLKDGGRGATGGGDGKHLSAFLVMGEMTLTIVLLAGAGVMIRSFLNIYRAEPGVKLENVLGMALSLPDVKYPRAETWISFSDRLKMRLEAIPGVETITISNTISPMGTGFKLPYELAGTPPVDEQRRPTLGTNIIGPDYFRTVGAAVLSGRDFSDADGVSGAPVAIVNRLFASRFWPGEDPLGKRLRLFDGKKPEAWLTVVGVVSNIKQGNTRLENEPLVYVPYRQKPIGSMAVFARTRVPPEKLATAFGREIRAIDPDLVIRGPWALADRLESYWNTGLFAALFLIFAVIALLLASVGLYAVVAYSVSRRTQEIGIRMSIGARAQDVLRLVFSQGMLPVGIGLVIGLGASLGVNRLLKAELVHVSPSDPITLAAATGVLILAAVLGCWIPARRAMRVDPAVALRHE